MGYELEHEAAVETVRRARRADCERCRGANCVRTDAAGDTHCISCGRREYPPMLDVNRPKRTYAEDDDD